MQIYAVIQTRKQTSFVAAVFTIESDAIRWADQQESHGGLFDFHVESAPLDSTWETLEKSFGAPHDA